MTIAFHEERAIFYYELGLAITQWAHVEHAFCHLYASTFKGPYNLDVPASFYAIENFRSKCQVADTIFQRNLSEAHLGEWSNMLQKELLNLSKVRNALAHRYILNRLDNKPGRRILRLTNYAAKRQSAKNGNSSRSFKLSGY